MIYLYGAGAYGVHTYYMLKQYGISVDGFIDQDYRKKGYLFDNISCITLEDVETLCEKEKMIVIVCVKKETDYIIKTLRMCSIERIYTFEQYKDEYLRKSTLKRKIPLQNSSSLHKMKDDFSNLFYHFVLDDTLDQVLIDIAQDTFVRSKRYEDS